MSKWRVGGLVILAACSSQADEQRDHRDGGEPAPVDAGPDARPCFKNFDPEDHGEVRVELVHRPDGTTAARASAFVYQDIGSTKFFPFSSFAGCTDLTSGMYWPTATNPIAERIYHDPGDVLISGGPNVLTVPRQTTQGVDVLGREHPAGAWFAHDAGPTANDGAQYLTPDAHLDIIFTGSANLPGQVLTDALYLPPTFELLSPGTESLAVASSQLTFTFTAPAASPPPDHDVLASVMFSGPQGPVVMCLEQFDGAVTVPHNYVDLVRTKLPDGGTLTRQALTITGPELDDDGPDVVDGCPSDPRVVYSTAANGYESVFTIAP